MTLAMYEHVKRPHRREERGRMVVIVAVDRLVGDHGTVVTLSGLDRQGRRVDFAADWRPAQEIIRALDAGEAPHVVVETWAILRWTRDDPAIA